MIEQELPACCVSGLESWSRLSGHSNSVVLLATRDGRSWFVRKIAGDEATAARLARQIGKQQAFAASDGSAVLAVPQMHGHSDLPGPERYYDMEYVRGQSITSFLTSASYDQVHWLAERLCEYLRIAWSARPISQAEDSSLFAGCFRKLVALANSRALGSDLSERLFLGLDVLHRHLDIAPTLCHGDFTFENVLVTHTGQLVAIDFLDGPFEHVWQDVAKLHQDISGEWYTLFYPSISRGVLSYLRHKITTFMTELSPIYEQVHYFLLALTFARILPYVRTESERQLVMSRVRLFTERIATR